MKFNNKKIDLNPIKSDLFKEDFSVFNVIKKNWAFILFSFINAFLPIIICIIAATIPNSGTEVMMSISFSSPFQLVFLNVPFILTFWFIGFIVLISRKYNSEQYSFKDIFWIILIFNIIVGIILAVIFYVASFCYIHFFYSGTNIELIAYQGELFLALFAPVILINSIGYVFTFFLFFKFGSLRIVILEILRLLFIIIFCFIFSSFTNWGAVGIGAGVLVGTSLSLLVNIIICIKVFEMWKYKYSFDINWVKYAIKNSWKFVFIKIFASLVKPLIFFVMGGHKNQQDPNFLISKTIWYFILYFITFFSDGISKIFMFHKVLHGNNYKLTKKSYRQINFLFLANFSILLTLALGAYFITIPLGSFMITNQESIINITNTTIKISEISTNLLLPSSLAILFTLFYCIFNSVNQIITDIRPMFEVEKESKLITTLITIIIVIGFILGIGLSLMKMPVVGGLSAFTVPMFAISFLFALGGVLGWIKFNKKYNNEKNLINN